MKESFISILITTLILSPIAYLLSGGDVHFLRWVCVISVAAFSGNVASWLTGLFIKQKSYRETYK